MVNKSWRCYRRPIDRR